MFLIPHIATANGNLERYATKIRSAVGRAEEIIVPKLNIARQIDISFAAMYQFLIPEDHIGGRTYTSEYIQVAVDPAADDISEDIFFEVISHELAHAARWGKNDERMLTLFDGLINEGLAVAFEEEIIMNNQIATPQFFLQSVAGRSDAENEKILAVLSNELDNERYDYDAIFFDGREDLPRWSGYSLGLHLVKKYLSVTNKTITDALADKYSDFRVVLK